MFGAQWNGLFVQDAGNNGIHLTQTGNDGIFIGNAGDEGLYIGNAGDDAIQVNDADDDGIFVNNSGNDGIHVNNAGAWSANIQGDKNGDGAMPSSYIAHFYNRATEGSADVLALKVGQTSGVGDVSHFIGFFEGDNQLIGRVEGYNGGVFYGTTNGDFAECLERKSQNDTFLAGEIVGVSEGKISHQIHSTDQVMVITDQAAVLGNMPKGKSEGDSGYEHVSFIGQIPTRVRGPVQSGDWIVPSGDDDGIGIAVSTHALTLSHKIVGQAWESSSDPGVKRINTAVGLDQSEVLKHIIKSQQDQIDELRNMMMEIKNDLHN